MRPLLIVFVSTLTLGLITWAYRVPADEEVSTTRSEKPAIEGTDHWAFQPLRIVKSPNVMDAGWCQTAVDPFVLKELESRKISPAVSADKRSLLRRVTYDLLGLPPTPEAMAEFLADDSDAAYVRVVERLLASPQYGERWGRHWLDVVRYADARDLIQLPVESDFREAWRYRDWVVSAFNRDLPYDKFIAMQVAGDVLQPADPAEIDVDALVATGFLAIADFVPGDVEKTQMIADYVNDQVDVLGRSVMGLTLGCARCHDHKYDPISIEDYYSLAGIFFSTRLIPSPVKGNTPLVRVPLIAPQRLREIEAETARDKARLAALPLEIATHVDRAYVTALRERIAKETREYLLAAWACSTARPEGSRHPTTVVATDRRLDNETLKKWVALFDETPIHPAIAPLRETNDEVEAGILADRFVRGLGEPATKSAKSESTPAGAPFAESQILRFRADDRRVQVDEEQRVIQWPNRSAFAGDATSIASVKGPLLAKAEIDGHLRNVLRFEGQQLLQVTRSVPAVGSLFVLFRATKGGDPSQRLIGWEDSAVGQHGIGLMPNERGGTHCVVRKNGASGDVVISPPPNEEFQLLSLAWGPGGVVVYRNGERVAHNPALDSVSSDPAIPHLNIGGPGSGGSARFRGDICELRVYGASFDDENRTRTEKEIQSRWFGEPSTTPEAIADPIADFYEELLSTKSPFAIAPADRLAKLPQSLQVQLAEIKAELERLQAKKPVEVARAVVVQEGGPAETSHAGFHDAVVYLRGNPNTPGKVVPRGIPRVLERGQPLAISSGSGRRELAEWLTGANAPLTARVLVNRVWQHHFGEGLVRTSTNFGRRGELPSHPELLDFLSTEFIASGWSIKSLHRLIVLSQTYQQSSTGAPNAIAADPENRWLSHMPRRRIEAEALRDGLLAVSGRLDNAGQGVGFLDHAVPRRSLYLMSVRTGAKAAEFCPLFDGPDGGGVIERRNQSIVAPQALFLLNDPFVDQASRDLAARIDREDPQATPAERVSRLYEIALGRPPAVTERQIALDLLAEAAVTDAWPRLCLVVLCSNEFLYID